MVQLSRRNLFATAVASGAAAAFATGAAPANARPVIVPAAPTDPPPDLAPSPADGVQLHWLDGVPTTTTGSAWGVPWGRGQVREGASFTLTTASGKAVPVQTWPLAYWPDGSVKWTGHGIGSDVALEETVRLAAGKPAVPPNPVTVAHDGGDVVLDNGAVQVRLATSGNVLVRSVTRDGRTTARNGRLVLELQDQPDDDQADARGSSWSGMIEHVDVDQTGPVRGVVKISGHYEIDQGPNHGNGRRTLLPWTVRVYLGAGAESLRLMHSFIWDADTSKDFVRGLGLQIDVPMTDAAHNRHIRFAGSGRGIWGEPVRVLTGLRRDLGVADGRDPGADVRAAQVAGTATPPVSQWSAQVRDGYENLAVWNDYTLAQSSPTYFSVWKRTSSGHSWLKDAGHGDRAPGLGYVGGVSGGLGFGIRDFWEQYPRALDIRGAAGDTATVTLWSWSPHADAMDMRPYDSAGHGLDLAYEDGRYGFGIPGGISRSTDIELWAFATTPSRDHFANLADVLSTPPQVVAAPATYHGAGVFGRWSLPDRSTPARTTLEDSIDASIDFYGGQVQQRQWYGFWDYGDVMYQYDADRHSWRYDEGGFAWDNAELGSDAMLWYAFLRSGKPQTFRLARAMTRHVSESDTYHAGQFAGLGSRHAVQHWGDGAKEVRVGESYTKRFMYYVTADELVGDWLRASLQADETLRKFEPLRDILPPQHVAPTRLRIGPDWYALVSNWLTEWERTGDTKWRDRIVTGMRDIASFPAGLFTGEGGGAVGFDPTTAHLVNLNKGDYTGGYNLAMAFCGDQVMFETVELVDVPEFRQTLLDFARYVQAPSAEKIAHYGFDFNAKGFKTIYSRVTAWAGEQLDDKAIRQRGWDQFLSDPAGKPWPAAVRVDDTAVLTPVEEIPAGDVRTSDPAQRNLAIVELLAIAPGEAP